MSIPQDQQRLGWADLAKAVCILLVVLYHARHTTYLLDWQTGDDIVQAWHGISLVLTPLRLPLFFVISGLLAAPSLTKGWAAIAYKRVYKFYYIYVLWAAVFLVFIPEYPRAGMDGVDVTLRIVKVVLGTSEAWYLWALASYFFLAWISRAWPWWLPLGIAFVVASIAPLVIGDMMAIQVSMLRCWFLFMLGIRLPHLVMSLAERATLTWLLKGSAIFIGIMVLSLRFGIHFNPVADALAAYIGIMAAVLVVRQWPKLSVLGAWLAQRTLTIYVFHFLILTALQPISALVLTERMLQSPLLAAVFPLLASVITVLCCLIIHWALATVKASWLFDAPRSIRSRASSHRGI